MSNQVMKWIARIVLALSTTVFAQSMDSVESRLSALQSEIDQLKKAQAHPHEKQRGTLDQLMSHVDLQARLEVEAFHGKTGKESASDLTLATVEVTGEIKMTKELSAHMGFLWEEDETEGNNLDEAYFTWGGSADIPYYLSAGKMYLPFGNFESAFISDPLTLELAEIRESAALLGYQNAFMNACAGVFNGDADDDSKLDNGVASISITPTKSIAVGAYWISDLLETDGMEGLAMALPSHEKMAGAGGFLHAQVGPLAIHAEYVTALNNLNTGVNEIKPAALHIEASIPVSEKMTVGMKVEGSNDFCAEIGSDKFADKQYGLVAAYAVNDFFSVAGEYLHANGLDENESSDQLTLQFALAF